MATDIVIAAKNAEDLIGPCLQSIVPQLDTASGDRVIVVDDGSTDETVRAAEFYAAQVVRLKDSVGPYEARNVGVSNSQADSLVFTDVRSRALPGWLASHKTQLSKGDVALSCTNVQVLSGPSYAERVSSVVNMFDLSNYVRRPGQLDYFPTCNLGVRHSAYASVNGFKKLRSGGDADLCWQIQRSGAGRLDADHRVLMVWKPRDTVTGLVEQAYRYGRGHSALLSGLSEYGTVPGLASDELDDRTSEAAGAGRLAILLKRLESNRGDVQAVIGSYALVVPSILGRAIETGSRLR